MKMDTPTWGRLRPRDQRGSRARCILFTNGPAISAARRLTDLTKPFAFVDPSHDVWMPNGISGPDEAKLGGTPQFLSAAHQEAVTSWWLAVRQHANTPNWDIVSTATIDGNRGLVLVEAKAHDTEMKRGGKPPGRAENDARIETACTEASRSLNSILDGWSLSVKSHYQLCNRFAWAWKIASLGVPVVLVYLGFIGATEMTDQGIPFVDADHWNRLVRSHCQGIVPDAAWDKPLQIAGTPLHAMIRSMEMPLSSS